MYVCRSITSNNSNVLSLTIISKISSKQVDKGNFLLYFKYFHSLIRNPIIYKFHVRCEIIQEHATLLTAVNDKIYQRKQMINETFALIKSAILDSYRIHIYDPAICIYYYTSRRRSFLIIYFHWMRHTGKTRSIPHPCCVRYTFWTLMKSFLHDNI